MLLSGPEAFTARPLRQYNLLLAVPLAIPHGGWLQTTAESVAASASTTYTLFFRGKKRESPAAAAIVTAVMPLLCLSGRHTEGESNPIGGSGTHARPRTKEVYHTNRPSCVHMVLLH